MKRAMCLVTVGVLVSALVVTDAWSGWRTWWGWRSRGGGAAAVVARRRAVAVRGLAAAVAPNQGPLQIHLP